MAPILTVEVPDLPLGNLLKIVAVQGDWELENRLEAQGGRWVIRDSARATAACMSLVAYAHKEGAHLAITPELAIPESAIEDLVTSVITNSTPLVFVGGIEGLVPDTYRALVNRYGGDADIASTGPGTFVNAMIVIVRSDRHQKVLFRAKRYASGAENAGAPEMLVGSGPFVQLRLGSTPFTVLPLICAELIWPELWDSLRNEASGLDPDVIPVLQRNHDPGKRYWGPVVHGAYQANRQSRFVLVNQVATESDGTCYVLVPPTAPNAPGFDHARHELWLDGPTYKGFRIPETTGCFWSAHLVHRTGPMNATRPPVCDGRVIEVLSPVGVDLAGLAAGLMRSAARDFFRAATQGAAEPKAAFRQAVDSADSGAYVLNGLSRTDANDAFFRMICDDRPTWSTVESLVSELIEASALIASGGDTVRLTPCPGGNCAVNGRPIACLFAPVVDSALSARFPPGALLSGEPAPAGIVLLKVNEGARNPEARTVGDVLRSDRVSSESLALAGAPSRPPASSVSIRLDDIPFCVVPELRSNLRESTRASAHDRAARILPGVFT